MDSSVGYYREPTLFGSKIAFVCDDDLWLSDFDGGVARRLTNHWGPVAQPRFSPDGQWIAYLAFESGVSNIHVIPSEGGVSRRITGVGAVRNLVGWTDNKHLRFTAAFEGEIPRRVAPLYSVHVETMAVASEGYRFVSHYYESSAGALIGRNCGDSARWKRYRGGTAGVLWARPKGQKTFQRILKNLTTNISSPRLVGDRVFFISDHEGIANVYSSDIKGRGVKRWSWNNEYYARNLETDGKHLVYHAGGDLHLINLRDGSEKKLSVACPSTATQLQSRHVRGEHEFEEAVLSKDLKHLAVLARGQIFTMPLWKGSAIPRSEKFETRFKRPCFSPDSKRLYAVGNDSRNDDGLWQWSLESNSLKATFQGQDWGKIRYLEMNPAREEIALVNNRNEIWLLDPKKGQSKKLFHSDQFFLQRPTWSPGGRYLVFAAFDHKKRWALRIYDSKKKDLRVMWTPVNGDFSPSFSPDGKLLYFLSVREFYPQYNETHFDLGFPKAVRPFVVTLSAKEPSPFEKSFEDPSPETTEKEGDKPGSKAKAKKGAQAKTTQPAAEPDIDFAGMEHRILPLPVELGGYFPDQLQGAKNGLYYLRNTPEPITDFGGWGNEGGGAELYFFNLEDGKEECVQKGVNYFEVVNKGASLLYHAKEGLRFVATGTKPSADRGIGRKDGWVDLNRISVKLEPREEWQQMYREAWTLQREHFWRADMSRIDWDRVYKRYEPLLARLRSRGELSDLMWEMQGELGTSHCYEFGGDYLRRSPQSPVGYLGATFTEVKDGLRIEKIHRGDSWIRNSGSPLLAPGVGLTEGDLLLAVDGQKTVTIGKLFEALENKAQKRVTIEVRRRGAKSAEMFVVTCLPDQGAACYRDWVEANKRYVHEKSGGKLGYVHVPDMGAHGYSEFYRHFIAECRNLGLVVDVRYNGGGHVSQHLLKVLAQRPLGFDETRYFGRSLYPEYAVPGSIVALTNEHAGSDGDIFSHSFKLMKLGPLIGKRTWGGVIGIWPRTYLRDGTITTQPEFSFWFKDVGWKVENYGTDPDIEVEITPEDDLANRDPQLDKAIAVALGNLKKSPPFNPLVREYPNLSLPHPIESGLRKVRKGKRA